MARIPTQKSTDVKHGFLEYLLLIVLVLVIVVTAWTLYDNGIIDTFIELIKSAR